MGIMTEVRPISGLILVFLPLFGMENREYLREGKRTKKKKKRLWENEAARPCQDSNLESPDS